MPSTSRSRAIWIVTAMRAAEPTACTSPKPTVATVEIVKPERVHPVLQARELVVPGGEAQVGQREDDQGVDEGDQGLEPDPAVVGRGAPPAHERHHGVADGDDADANSSHDSSGGASLPGTGQTM